MLKLGVRGALHENFPNDARRNSFIEDLGSWRGGPSKIAPRKFPKRCASKFAQRRSRNLAKKSIEDRSTKISQTMRVENTSFRLIEKALIFRFCFCVVGRSSLNYVYYSSSQYDQINCRKSISLFSQHNHA